MLPKSNHKTNRDLVPNLTKPFHSTYLQASLGGAFGDSAAGRFAPCGVRVGNFGNLDKHFNSRKQLPRPDLSLVVDLSIYSSILGMHSQIAFHSESLQDCPTGTRGRST